MAKAAAKKAADQASRITLKTPKGTRDFGPRQMAVRERVIALVADVFKRHGAETIDTPVFELRDVLMGKYGDEGAKLVFDLVDQGGELCSLRYDLTVPFARYLAMNKLTNAKRYQIAKVYRRDQPVMTKGRYREFYQCDFDIAGSYDPMVPEAECLKIADEVLAALDVGDYEIKLNHRLLLEGMFEASGVPPEHFKAVCSSVDKLDKQPWAEVERELLDEKKIAPHAVQNLEKFVRLRELNPSKENGALLAALTPLLASLAPSPALAAAAVDDESRCIDAEGGEDETGPLSEGGTAAKAAAQKEKKAKKEAKRQKAVTALSPAAKLRQAVEELSLLLAYTECLGCTPGRVAFDPSLARGLDYYTGAIYEVVVKEFSFNTTASPAPDISAPSAQPSATSTTDATTTVAESASSTPVVDAEEGEGADSAAAAASASGPIGSVAAGGRYDKLVGMFQAKAKDDVPCVGISFGIERLFTIMEMKAASAAAQRVSPTDVYVASAQKNLLQARMRLSARLWDANIRAEFSYKANPKLLTQIQYCEERRIPWILTVGEREMEQGVVRLRNVATREEMDINLDDVVDVLRQRLRVENSRE